MKPTQWMQIGAMTSVLALTGTAIADDSGSNDANHARAQINSAGQLGTDLNTSEHAPAAVNSNSPAQLGSDPSSNPAAELGTTAPGATVPNDSDAVTPEDSELPARSLTDTPMVTPR